MENKLIKYQNRLEFNPIEAIEGKNYSFHYYRKIWEICRLQKLTIKQMKSLNSMNAHSSFDKNIFEFDIPVESLKEIQNSKFPSKIQIEKEFQYENVMFALPFDEWSNLILYESKAEIDPLAQVIPFLHIKSRQIPKITEKQEKEILSARDSDKSKESLSIKIPSYTSFQK